MTNKKQIDEMNDQEIQAFFEKHMPVKTKEKKKYGEVFTSPIVIEFMLDLFPKSKWSDPHLKWLDPSAGTGFFFICVYRRLMKGLSSFLVNEKKRSNYIIKNMLFMVEINKTNCDILTTLFGPNANIVCNDFLEKNTCDHIPFDCIVGNPPFQDDTFSKGTGGKSKLYERIFMKAFTILKRSGYLSFITPDNIFSGNTVESYNILVKNKVDFVSFSSKIQTFFPGIQQYMCYFLLQKRESRNDFKTLIENTDGTQFNVVLEDRRVNPVRNWTPRIEKLVKKYITNKKNATRYNRGKSLASYKGNKYSLIYTASKKIGTNKEGLAVGLGIKKAVIFAISPDLNFEMDYAGKYGIGPNTFYIPFNTMEEGKRLERFLKSEDYKSLALATKTTRQYLKIGFVEHLNLEKIMGSAKTRKRNINKNGNRNRINIKTRKNINN